MSKAHRNQSLRERSIKRNNLIKRTRWVVEQTFGTIKRIFNFRKAKYFTTQKVENQAYFMALCLNLLKGSNKIVKVF